MKLFVDLHYLFWFYLEESNTTSFFCLMSSLVFCNIASVHEIVLIIVKKIRWMNCSLSTFVRLLVRNEKQIWCDGKSWIYCR